MRKNLYILIFLTSILVSPAASAALQLDLDLDLDISGGSEDSNSSENNNTYGERVGGQSVHQETEPQDPNIGRNSQDLQITEDSESSKKGLLSGLMSFLGF